MRVARRHPLVHAGAPAAGPDGRLRAVVAAAWGRALRHFQEQARERCFRTNEQALARLPDRILKDIGLGRSEIPYASRSPAFERERRLLRQRHGRTVACPAAESSGRADERPAGPATRTKELRCR